MIVGNHKKKFGLKGPKLHEVNKHSYLILSVCLVLNLFGYTVKLVHPKLPVA